MISFLGHMMKLIGRIWLPAAVFVAFLLALLNRGELYEGFIANGRFVSEGMFIYGVQMGAWLSSAFSGQSPDYGFLVGRFYWEGFQIVR